MRSRMRFWSSNSSSFSRITSGPAQVCGRLVLFVHDWPGGMTSQRGGVAGGQAAAPDGPRKQPVSIIMTPSATVSGNLLFQVMVFIVNLFPFTQGPAFLPQDQQRQQVVYQGQDAAEQGHGFFLTGLMLAT